MPVVGYLSEDLMADYIEGPNVAWWLCTSKFSRGQLRRLFNAQDVAVILYEDTGAFIDLGRTADKRYLLAIQLRRHGNHWDWALDLSLEDIHIVVEERITEDDVERMYTQCH